MGKKWREEKVGMDGRSGRVGGSDAKHQCNDEDDIGMDNMVVGGRGLVMMENSRCVTYMK